VCYDQNENEFFGEIEQFFEFDNQLFCFINVFNDRLKVIEIIHKSSNFISQIFHNYFDKYFAVFNHELLKPSKKIINCNEIKFKCLVVNNQNYKFLSKIQYDFEHD
jgi:hypothetical protein